LGGGATGSSRAVAVVVVVVPAAALAAVGAVAAAVSVCTPGTPGLSAPPSRDSSSRQQQTQSMTEAVALLLPEHHRRHHSKPAPGSAPLPELPPTTSDCGTKGSASAHRVGSSNPALNRGRTHESALQPAEGGLRLRPPGGLAGFCCCCVCNSGHSSRLKRSSALRDAYFITRATPSYDHDRPFSCSRLLSAGGAADHNAAHAALVSPRGTRHRCISASLGTLPYRSASRRQSRCSWFSLSWPLPWSLSWPHSSLRRTP
jgi:hypothetical protein